MPTIIQHRISETEALSNPLLASALEQQALTPDEDGSYVFTIECEEFYIIPAKLRSHRIMQVLENAGLLSFEADDNRILLPVSPYVAYMLQKSPYADPPIDSYVSGLTRILDDTSRIFDPEHDNDSGHCQNLFRYIAHLQKSMRDALDNAKLLAAVACTPEEWSAFQKNWAALQSANTSVRN